MNVPPSSPSDDNSSLTKKIWQSFKKMWDILGKFVGNENNPISPPADDRNKPQFDSLLLYDIDHSKIMQSDAMSKVIEITSNKRQLHSKVLFSDSVINDVLRVFLADATCEQIKKCFTSLESLSYPIYEQILDLHENGEDVDEYMEMLRKIRSDILAISLNEYSYLLYNKFSYECINKEVGPDDPDRNISVDTGKQCRVALKSWFRAVSMKIASIEKAIRMLQKNVQNHYHNKKEYEKRELARQEILQKRAMEKQKLSASQIVMEDYKNNIQFNLDYDLEEIHRLNALLTRVYNIETKIQDGALSEDYREELMAIDVRISDFSINSHSLDIIQKIYFVMDGILLGNIAKNKKSSNENIVLENENSQNIVTKENAETHAENIEFINKIEELLTINYLISSTKNKTDSYGDGSFAMNTFRPFLRFIKTLLNSNKISFRNGISWNEIIKILEKNHDDNDRARVHLYWILKESTNKTENLKDILKQLREAIVKFSNSTYYHGSKDTSLKNFLEKLDEFLQ